MRFILFILLIAFGPTAIAYPACWPRQFGSTGGDWKEGKTEDGRWVGWICKVNGKEEVHGFWGVNEYKVKQVTIKGLSPIDAARAYWNANVDAKKHDAKTQAKLDRIRKSMMEAFGK